MKEKLFEELKTRGFKKNRDWDEDFIAGTLHDGYGLLIKKDSKEKGFYILQFFDGNYIGIPDRYPMFPENYDIDHTVQKIKELQMENAG